MNRRIRSRLERENRRVSTAKRRTARARVEEPPIRLDWIKVFLDHSQRHAVVNVDVVKCPIVASETAIARLPPTEARARCLCSLRHGNGYETDCCVLIVGEILNVRPRQARIRGVLKDDAFDCCARSLTRRERRRTAKSNVELNDD